MSCMLDILNVLFDEGEQTCFAETPFETELKDAQIGPNSIEVFFSINPMHTRRADANVTCYRNILLECDTLPLNEQRDYVESKLPVSSIVYSGGKSLHFIISLEEPCQTRDEYDLLVRRIHKLLPKVDPTSKNPSRFSRLADIKRPDTGKEQELVLVGSRIPRATLEAALPPPDTQKVHEKQPEGFFSTLVVDAMFKPDEVMAKVGIQGRNAFFFWLGQRLREGGAGPDQKRQIIEHAYANLKNKSDFRIQEALAAGRIKE